MDTKTKSSKYSTKTKLIHYGPHFILVSGILILASGILSLIKNKQIYDHILRKELGLSPYSKSFDIWHETPVPMYLEFYFFNWTNYDKLATEKPSFTEIGPFRFTETQEKVNVTWNYNNDTVSYRRRKFWYFDEDNSVGSLDDIVITLNAVALTAAFTVRDWNYLLRKSLSVGLTTTSQRIYIKKKVRELLFDGYEDKLINLARSMPAFKGVEIPYDKFGWFYSRNGSSHEDGIFNMETGSKDIKNLGILKNWNHDNMTTFFNDQCSEIIGSAGEFWPPNQTRDNPLRMYSPDLCRSISFSYLEDRVVNDIPGYTYILDKNLLDNGTLIFDNSCYCNGICSPSGVINVSSCHFGAPAFVSYPHFYQADQYYIDSVDGMKPEPHKHQFYMTLEPTVGIPLDVGARLQINLLLQPIESVDLYKDVPEVYFPMFWFNQRATMPPDMAESLKIFLSFPRYIIMTAISVTIFGCFVVIVSSILLYLRKKRKKTSDYNFNDNIISVQMKTNEEQSSKPLMSKTRKTSNCQKIM